MASAEAYAPCDIGRHIPHQNERIHTTVFFIIAPLLISEHFRYDCPVFEKGAFGKGAAMKRKVGGESFVFQDKAEAEEKFSKMKREFAPLVEALEGTGVKFKVELSDLGKGSAIYVGYSIDPDEVDVLKTRRAGRRPKEIPYDSPLYGLTCAEALEWLEDNTEAAGREAFGGCGRSTYHRRKAAMRKAASEIPDEKAWLVFLPRKDREELGLFFNVPKSN